MNTNIGYGKEKRSMLEVCQSGIMLIFARNSKCSITEQTFKGHNTQDKQHKTTRQTICVWGGVDILLFNKNDRVSHL